LRRDSTTFDVFLPLFHEAVISADQTPEVHRDGPDEREHYVNPALSWTAAYRVRPGGLPGFVTRAPAWGPVGRA
jgi:hypothetical protein